MLVALLAAMERKYMEIDGAFIRQWHLRYELTEHDEPEYRRLIDRVAGDISSTGTISKQTFLAIFSWKGAMRVIGQVKLDAYDDLYAPAFHRAFLQHPDGKLAELLTPGHKLPGIGAPTGSTIIHFMHPHLMPIIDVRTVNVLFKARLIKSTVCDLSNYRTFQTAIEKIRRDCPSWSLREIDRALFAYHKQVLAKRSDGKSPAQRDREPNSRRHAFVEKQMKRSAPLAAQREDLIADLRESLIPRGIITHSLPTPPQRPMTRREPSATMFGKRLVKKKILRKIFSAEFARLVAQLVRIRRSSTR